MKKSLSVLYFLIFSVFLSFSQNAVYFEELIFPDDFDEEISFEEYKPSRSISVKIFEKIEVKYPGNNWIYAGLTDNTKDIIFVSKKETSNETIFVLQARNAGKKFIHFYKKDFIREELFDDFIEADIQEELGDENTIISPEPFFIMLTELDDPVFDMETDLLEEAIIETQKEIDNTSFKTEPDSQKIEQFQKTTPIKEKKEEPKTSPVKEKPETASKSASKIDNSATSVTDVSIKTPQEEIIPQINAIDILKEAIKLYNNKAYKQAYEAIERYLNITTSNFDEGYFYKGKILEEKSEVQNISEALKAYNLLLKNHPNSKYWDDANKRSIYLKKFYLEAR